MSNNNAPKSSYWQLVCRSLNLRYCCFFVLTVLWLELVLRYFTVANFWSFSLVWLVLLSLPLGFLAVLLSSLLHKRGNTIISCVLVVLFAVLIMVQLVYYTIFNAYFTLYSLTGTGKVLAFWQAGFNGILKAGLPLLLSAVPLVFWLVKARKWVSATRISVNSAVALIFIMAIAQLGAFVGISLDHNGTMSRSYLYNQAFVPQLSVANFGGLTTYRLDIKNLCGGMNRSSEAAETTVTPEQENSNLPPNVLAIDYTNLIENETDDIIKDMHQYFQKKTPTYQNEYTGIYADKNLIWICAEGFSSWALDQEKTPTLYKLAHEGYVFENFYNPIWGVSTSDGEYTTCTGLIPKAGVWSFYKSGANYMPFCLGNQLKAQGYSTRAYHDHSYTYYRRDVSHPNMGYDYKGVGNGLNMTITWPESDVEMMELTVPEYINDEAFHTYYMSVSGHLEYNFTGNAMAQKHRDEVADLPYSEAARAYIACNIEFDRAVANLMSQLEAADKLEDTLIVISGDHYPYGLTHSEIEELNGAKVDSTFELYRSTLIMWEQEMPKPVRVKKVCSPIDILPTLSNLWGLPYDSRLLMGQDIFSDSEGLVVFSDHSWLTGKGRYNAQTNEFIAASGVTADDSYAPGVMANVNAMFDYAAKILEYDYYAKVITGDILAQGIDSSGATENNSGGAEAGKENGANEEKQANAWVLKNFTAWNKAFNFNVDDSQQVNAKVESRGNFLPEIDF